MPGLERHFRKGSRCAALRISGVQTMPSSTAGSSQMVKPKGWDLYFPDEAFSVVCEAVSLCDFSCCRCVVLCHEVLCLPDLKGRGRRGSQRKVE